MDYNKVLEFVNPAHREWASNLTPSQLAHIISCFKLQTTAHTVSTVSPSAVVEVSESPVRIGQVGEKRFSDICADGLSALFTVEDCAKRAHAGDFHIKWTSPRTFKEYSIIVDVKNYGKTVPSKEVDKFFSDIQRTQSHSGGLLLSLKSRITGFGEWTHVVRDNVSCLMVRSNNYETICESIRVLFGVIEMNDSTCRSVDNVKLVMGKIRNMEQSINAFSRSRSALQSVRTTILTQIDQVTTELCQSEFEIKNCIAQITTALMPVPNCETKTDEPDEPEEPEEPVDINQLAIDWGCTNNASVQFASTIITNHVDVEINEVKKIISFSPKNELQVEMKFGKQHITIYISNFVGVLDTPWVLNSKKTKASCKITENNYPHIITQLTT